MDAPHFTVEVNTDSDQPVLTLAGDVDMYATTQLLGDITTSLQPFSLQNGLTIDVRQVDFIDSTGLGMLVGLRNKVRRSDGALTLRVRRGSQVSVMLGHSGLGSVVNVDAS